LPSADGVTAVASCPVGLKVARAPAGQRVVHHLVGLVRLGHDPGEGFSESTSCRIPIENVTPPELDGEVLER
jgi:hypothetical protein